MKVPKPKIISSNWTTNHFNNTKLTGSESLLRVTARLILLIIATATGAFQATAAGIDLSVRILSAPTYLVNDQETSVRVEVANRSPRPYSGGSGFVTLWHGPITIFNAAVSRQHTNTSAGQSAAFTAEYAIPSLAAGGITVLDVPFVPTHLPFVPHTLRVSAIGPNDINLANSLDQVGVYVVTPQPDLVVTAIKAPPRAKTGAKIVFEVEVRNRGLTPAVGWTTFGAVISLYGQSPFLKPSDVPIGNFSVNLSPPLGLNEARVFRFESWPLPWNLVHTSQYLAVCTDVGFPFIGELNEGNNCLTVPIHIDRGFYDIQFQLVAPPQTALRCSTVAWGVRVSNRGNVPAPSLPFLSGIGLGSGPLNWNNNLGLFYGQTGDLNPGESRIIRVRGYAIPCNAFTTTQFVRVELDYRNNPSGDGMPAGNFVQARTRIR